MKKLSTFSPRTLSVCRRLTLECEDPFEDDFEQVGVLPKGEEVGEEACPGEPPCRHRPGTPKVERDKGNFVLRILMPAIDKLMESFVKKDYYSSMEQKKLDIKTNFAIQNPGS